MKVPNRRELNTDVPFAPRGYENVNPDANAFGAMNAKALASVARGTAEIVNASIAIKEQNDEMRLLDFSNKINDLRTKILYDKENGYLNMKGENAAGKTDEVMTNFMSSADEILQNSKFFGTSKMKAANFVKKVGTNLFENVNAHDIQQTSVRDKVIFEKCNTTQINTLLENRNDPKAFNNYLANMITASDIFARSQGLDDNQKSALVNASEANGVKTLLDSYLADNNMKSFIEVFNKYSDKLSPDVQADYQAKITQYEFRNKVVETADSIMTSCATEAERFKAIEKIKDIDLQDNVRQRVKSLTADENRIKNEQMRYQARSFAENIISLTPESAYRQINAIENIDLRNYVLSEYERLQRQKDIAENEKKSNIRKAFYENYYNKRKNGEYLTFDDIPEELDIETKISMMNFINNNGSPETDLSVWELLYEKSVNDAQGFVKEDLNKYRGFLSDSEYKSFLKRQDDIKTGNYYTTIKDDDDMINTALESMGLKNKKKNVAFSEIRSLVREFEARKGRKISDKELENIINSMGFKDENGVRLYKQIEKGMGERTGFIKDVINDFAYYQSKHNGEMPPDNEKMNIINKRVKSVISKQNNDAQKTLKNEYSPKIGDVWNGHIITSLYGKRTAPTKGATTEHKGIDLAYKNNEIFPAFSSGIVIAVGKNKGLGNYVDIKSEDGIVHRYGHANSILVNVGTKVNAGDKIGRAGSTGVSTGPHLHYSKIKNGNFINPLDNNEKTIFSQNSSIKIAVDKNGNKARVEVDSSGNILRVIEEL